jgi:Tfp pilus assembly protein PilP
MVKAKQPHSLVGVLESGDRSSALFSWDGLTQRIQVGEAIGGSGWTLMGVSNQKAILSRQGKTRYLEVGQSF